MPLVRLEYDDKKVPDADVEALSQAVRDIVSNVTGIADVFVYANTAKIKVQIAPIEIFVEMTAKKIQNEDELIAKLREEISSWKKSVNFTHPINLTLIPMNWRVEIDI
jgi:hypothetical protein